MAASPPPQSLPFLREHPCPIQLGNIHILPVLHGCVEFADRVRWAVAHLKPDVIAVALPQTLQPYLEQAIQALPALSVLLYEDEWIQPVYQILEPTDPMIEAMRSGQEAGIPVHLIDIDINATLQSRDPTPDPYAVHRIGLTAYYQAFVDATQDQESADSDRRREQAMAYRLQQLDRTHERILFVCEMPHIPRLCQDLRETQAMPFTPRQRHDVSIFHLHPDSIREICHEYPFLIAVYESRRRQLPPLPDTQPLPVETSNLPFQLLTGGRDLDRSQRRWDTIYHTAHRAHTVLEGTDTQLPPQHLHPLDRTRVQAALIREATEWYRAHTGDKVHVWQMRLFNTFATRYAHIDQALVPDLYQLLHAARSCVGDDFCYEVWDLATTYPWQAETGAFPTIQLSGHDLFLPQRNLTIRRTQPRRKPRSLRFPITPRPRERFAGEWRQEFHQRMYCSYPPEDRVLEHYGQYVRKKGIQLLSEEHAKVEPFESSLLDGIDVRETIRHWYEKKIYVRELQPIHGGVGSVVMIFDHDTEHNVYPHKATWLGEHDQESDMAFYSTPLDHQLVGPGIARCEYGGFMLTYPPMRLVDIWNDPEYRSNARTKAELLLMAAIDYALEKYVVYVADKPCRRWFHGFAAQLQRKLIYIPLGQLSPIAMQRIRRFHILDGKDRRTVAKDYIF